MAIKFPKSVTEISKGCGLFYPAPSIGETLIEVRGDRRQKVVKVPAFIKKIRLSDAKLLRPISPLLKRPDEEYYGYRAPIGLVTTRQVIHIWERGRFPSKDIKDWIGRGEGCGRLLGNHVSLVNVKNNNNLLCRYIICGRFMGNSDEELSNQILRHPTRFSTHLVEGDESYITESIPRGENLVGFSGWVTDGFYFDGVKLIIGPIPKTVFPTKTGSRAGAHLVKLEGSKAPISIDSCEDLSNIYFTGYRSEDRLRFKLDASNYNYIRNEELA